MPQFGPSGRAAWEETSANPRKPRGSAHPLVVQNRVSTPAGQATFLRDTCLSRPFGTGKKAP